MKTINLDITHRCTLQCINCQRSIYKKVPGYDMPIEEYTKIADYFDVIRFCGNISDPVFNPNFIDFLRINYERNIKTKVHNAATGKSLDWYKRAFEANPDALWIFGIDGLPKDSHIYRKNQRGEDLFKAMILCNSMGLHTVWQHIIFKYNENTMDECKRIASENDIELVFIKSNRWRKDDPLKPLNQNNYI